MVDVKRRARFARPYAKTEGDPVGGGFQPPEKPSPSWGEGVAAYAATDEGSFFSRLSHDLSERSLLGGIPFVAS